MNKVAFERLIFVFLPWGLALLLKSDPALSYFIAWLGSFFIFFIVLIGWVTPLPDDRPVPDQIMRPIFLVHIIFAGYMACTSIFYFLNTLGYVNFQKTSAYFLVDKERLNIVAECQRYYCLGHAAFVTGILLFMRYPVKQYFTVEIESIANLLFQAAIISYPLSVVFQKVPGLSQFANQFTALSFMAGTLALAFAIPQKKTGVTLAAFVLYLFNIGTALLSGFKEPVLLSVLILGVFLYPAYKKVVLLTFTPLLFVLFLLLPTYAAIFRSNAWGGETSAEEARELALDAALNQDSEDLAQTNWGFLVYRLSEIDMFTLFVQSTPEKVDFYNLGLVKQSAIALVPRVFWPSKPSTEALVMERVYDAGVIYRASKVSAKPAYIVDGYLSGGTLGVIISMFIYGAAAQLISQKAEELFGGYLLGTALIFSGLFQIFWRGLSFEFIANTVFWSYVSMLLIAKLLRQRNILQPV